MYILLKVNKEPQPQNLRFITSNLFLKTKKTNCEELEIIIKREK